MSWRSRGTRILAAVAAGTAISLALLIAPGLWDEVQLRTGVGLPQRTAPAMEIVAHRGDLEHFPEDTLEAIVAASQTRADGIEFDVHRSADGTWWVIHDPTLDATTSGSGRISQLSDDVIGSAVIDGGFGFDPTRHVGLRVATLRSVLAALEGWSGDLYIDLQHAESGDVSGIVALLDGRVATILCRNATDAAAVARVEHARVLCRRSVDEADSYVNGWLVDAHAEVTPDRAAASHLPYVTFVAEGEFGRDESDLLRRAWASNVRAFLTKRLSAALDFRERLLAFGDW